jgi:hypothetical protein
MKKISFVFFVSILFACNNSNNSSGTGGDTAQEPPAAQNDDKPSASSASGCSAFFWFKKGVVMQYEMSDGTGKYTDTTSTTIEDVHQDGAALIADYTTTLSKGKMVKASYRCEGDKYMDMKSMFSGFATQRAGMEIEVTDAYISFPWNMKEGDNLDDAKFAITSKQNGKEFMKMTSTVKERKVESRDNVTTPAGSWDCLKITETRTTSTEMSGKQISSKDTKSVQWFAPQAGLVKFELYDEAGKVLSRSQLISLKTD